MGGGKSDKSFISRHTITRRTKTSSRSVTSFLLYLAASIELKSFVTHEDKPDARELCIATANGDLDEIKRLVRKGADVNAWDHDGRVAAHLAARAGDIMILKYLIRHGANVNSQDRWHVTPLQEAVRSRQGEAMSMLKHHGAVVMDRSIGQQLCTLAASGDLAKLEDNYRAGVDMFTGDYDCRFKMCLCTHRHAQRHTDA